MERHRGRSQPGGFRHDVSRLTRRGVGPYGGQAAASAFWRGEGMTLDRIERELTE